MDLNSRGPAAPNDQPPNHRAPAAHIPTAHPSAHGLPRRKHIDWATRTVRLELFIVILGSALILAFLALYLGFSSNQSLLDKQINNNEYQALFLNNGQVYFGKITTLNDKYVILHNIFYIENPQQSSATQNQNTNYTLRKLGTTELHAPEDEMVVNQSQVSFWENLKDSSQVVTKIKEYYKNPGAAQQNSAPANSSSTQGQ